MILTEHAALAAQRVLRCGCRPREVASAAQDGGKGRRCPQCVRMVFAEHAALAVKGVLQQRFGIALVAPARQQLELEPADFDPYPQADQPQFSEKLP